MKRIFKNTLILLSFIFIFQSCGEDYDDVLHFRTPNEFIWKGLNEYYYWQNESTDLNDARFNSIAAFQNFVNSYPSPEDLFDHLLVDASKDRFSVLFSNYEALEAALQGTNNNNGVDYGLKFKTGSTTDIFGFVRYILPNSDASTKNIQRGDIFYAVNGVSLTIDNYRELLASENYTLNLADYDNGNITPNGNSVSLTKTPYSENPVLVKNVHNVGAKKVGYLMYNGFYTNYRTELNDAFAYFQGEGITHFILDLRYNSGGSVQIATELASMITGQFTGQVFAQQVWNDKRTAYFNNTNPDVLFNKFTNTLGNGEGINSLNLSKIYILTSSSTASASELIINSLKPYITVVQIGDKTVGKNVGSVTLYDSPTFRKENINPKHKYAMQPIVLKIINSAGLGEYQNGLLPNVPFTENYGNLGVLGENTEPLLSIALSYINSNGRVNTNSNVKVFEHVTDSKNIDGIEKGMYIELK